MPPPDPPPLCRLWAAQRCRRSLHPAPGPPVLQGTRETARRVLGDKGVSVLAGAQVSEMRKAGAGGGSNGNGGGGGGGGEGSEDLAKRLVYLTDSEGQQEVSDSR